jgi:hypothetical protein
MSRRSIDGEKPDRLYTLTGGRSRANEEVLDLVTLIVSECDPTRGMQSEHAKILRLCRTPLSVVEISSYLELPVSVVKILLCDLLDTGRITARHPSTARADGPNSPETATLPDTSFLEKVLVGLRSL